LRLAIGKLEKGDVLTVILALEQTGVFSWVSVSEMRPLYPAE
jgi:hypothetical protein